MSRAQGPPTRAVLSPCHWQRILADIRGRTPGPGPSQAYSLMCRQEESRADVTRACEVVTLCSETSEGQLGCFQPAVLLEDTTATMHGTSLGFRSQAHSSQPTSSDTGP